MIFCHINITTSQTDGLRSRKKGRLLVHRPKGGTDGLTSHFYFEQPYQHNVL